MPKIIAQMVAKDESDRFLDPVLRRLRRLVDEIIFTDDCSSDNTPQIAEDYGAHVMVTPKPLFRTNESELRTLAWKHLEKHAEPGDWILAIDADEMLYGTDALPPLLDQTNFDVIGITFYHFWSPYQYRVDKLWAPTLSSRLFRFFPGGEFASRNLACGSEPTYVQELIRRRRFYGRTELKMAHLGYMKDEDKLMKYKRYMELDGGAFHNRDHLESIIDENPTLKIWEDKLPILGG